MITDMQAGGLIPPDEDVDDIVAEMDAATAATQDAQNQALQDRATVAAGGGKKAGPVDVLNPDGSVKMKLVPSAA